jgi:glutamate N-acetyltransferase/amino-acid N-acetyltransferase
MTLSSTIDSSVEMPSEQGLSKLARVLEGEAVKDQKLVLTQGNVTSPIGFKASSVHAGLKKVTGSKDLVLIWSEMPCAVAAVFTTNVMKAAPILWDQKLVAESKSVQGIVINSGNANACTGKQGMDNAEIMAKSFADAMRVSAKEILVASTGVIGVQLPIDKVAEGIKSAAASLADGEEAGLAAAEGIMTTDTFAKHVCVKVEIGGKPAAIGGIAKGSGMIHPNMATMLSFITTDVSISPALLQKALQESVEDTYNMISVDGDTSTNDMVAILANGQAQNSPIDEEGLHYQEFCKALTLVNTVLSKAIIYDGEGATKFLEVRVERASSVSSARCLAKAVISSNLVKAAFFGEDANWGRIICAMGYSGVNFSPEEVSISLKSAGGWIELLKQGEPAYLDEALAKRILAEKEIVIEVSLGSGDSSAKAWGCDLSYDYVRINGAYRT